WSSPLNCPCFDPLIVTKNCGTALSLSCLGKQLSPKTQDCQRRRENVSAGPQGPDSGGGIMAAIILWGVVSLIFFIANTGLLISSVARGRSAMKPLIACALPIVCVVLPLVLEPFFVR